MSLYFGMPSPRAKPRYRQLYMEKLLGERGGSLFSHYIIELDMQDGWRGEVRLLEDSFPDKEYEVYRMKI